MSLLVNVYVRDSNGEIELVDQPNPWEELAGFESYRHKLYGSRAARALGLQLLPTLDGGDLYAEGANVERLHEAELALANIELFVEEARDSAEGLRVRFENIVAATHQAMAIGGGVVIW